MKMRVDVKTLLADVRRNSRGLRAIRETVEDSGVGNIVVGKRDPIFWEKTKIKHNKAIANIIAKRIGREAIRPSGAEMEMIEDEMIARIEKALERAWQNGRPDKVRVQEAMRLAAIEGAEIVQRQIAAGGLGKVGKKTAIKKAWLTKAGFYTKKYGVPQPYGVATGRFVESVDGEWKPSTRKRD